MANDKKDEKKETASNAAAAPEKVTYPRAVFSADGKADEMSAADAVKLVGGRRVVTVQETRPGKGDKLVMVDVQKDVGALTAKEVFAVNEYADKYHIITTDGQRLVAKK